MIRFKIHLMFQITSPVNLPQTPPTLWWQSERVSHHIDDLTRPSPSHLRSDRPSPPLPPSYNELNFNVYIKFSLRNVSEVDRSPLMYFYHYFCSFFLLGSDKKGSRWKKDRNSEWRKEDCYCKKNLRNLKRRWIYLS